MLIFKCKPTLLPYGSVYASNVTFRPHMLLHICEMTICNLEVPHSRAGRLSKIQRMPGVFPSQIDPEQRLEEKDQVSHMDRISNTRILTRLFPLVIVASH